MRKIFDRYEAMTAGELSSFEGSEADVMMFVSAHKGQLNMVFNFDTVSLGHKDRTKAETKLFQVADFKSEVTRWQAFVDGTDGWITNFLENHDNMRSISHYGDDSLEYRVRSGKMLAMISATMTGTLFLYQGQEIGMVNAPRWWPPEEYKDVRSVNYYKKALERFKDDPKALEAAVASMWGRARDHARLPMQWNDGPNAGFTSPGVTPWMRIHDGWRENNAEQQMKDHNSLLSFWKRLLQLRKDYKDLFVYGRYKWLETDDEDVFIYTKEGDSGMKLITVVNMSNKQKTWDGLPEILGTNYTTKIFNVEEVDESILSPWEGRVYINTS
jgi:glycosidase